MENRKILVVDDDEFIVALLDGILKKEKYEVLHASNAVQALELAQTVVPSLIITDVTMPEINGYDLCRMLKATPKTLDIPVIFLTAKDEAARIDECFDCGGADYVRKPFQQKELLARIRTHIRLSDALAKLENADKITAGKSV
jgi:DNA-binding response OmpR family regulator